MDTAVTIYKPQTGVMLRREMAKMPAVMEGLSPIEKSVFLASTAKTFAEYDNTELVAELAKALKYIAKDVGYRDTDEGERGYLVVRLCEILRRYYGGFSLRDFRMAFEMSITGELDEFLPKNRDGQADRGHYQQFNAEYVCKILNAYKGRRNKILKKASEQMPPQEERPDPVKEAYWLNKMRRDCVMAYLHYKYCGRIRLSPIGEMLCYDTLAAVGLADEVEVTPEVQKKVWQKTINEYLLRGAFSGVKKLKEAGSTDPEIEDGAYILARRKALRSTFEWMVEHEIQITDYIKFE